MHAETLNCASQALCSRRCIQQSLTRGGNPFTYLGRDQSLLWESPMKRSLNWVAVVMFALGVVPSVAFAQPGSFGGGFGPALKVVPPPKAFATSDEHYAYLFEQA